MQITPAQTAGQVFPRREAEEAPYITSWRESINNLQPQRKVLEPKHGKNSVVTPTSSWAVKLYNTFTQHSTILYNFIDRLWFVIYISLRYDLCILSLNVPYHQTTNKCAAMIWFKYYPYINYSARWVGNHVPRISLPSCEFDHFPKKLKAIHSLFYAFRSRRGQTHLHI